MAITSLQILFHTQISLCVFQDWSLCFPSPVKSFVIKSCWPSRSDSPGIPGPFAGSSGWEAWRGVQNLHKSGRTSLVLFSSLWVTHPVGVGFDFIVIAPLQPSHYLFFFVFGCVVSSSVGFQHPFVNGCLTASCNFGALAGGDEHMSCYSAILNWKPHT